MANPTSPLVRLATRRSPLALAQARETAMRLSKVGVQVRIDTFNTTGDRIVDRALLAAGGKGLFTKELDEALLSDRAEIAVHSLKDVPTELPDGLVLAAFLPREDPRDVLIAPNAKRIEDLPKNAKLGTASIRRQAQALRIRPDLKPAVLRGNVQTRMRKVRDGEVDATFLAKAGLNRLGRSDIGSPIPVTAMPPAPCQGIVAIAAKADAPAHVQGALAAINDADAEMAAAAERAFLAALDGSCRTPIGGHCAKDAQGRWTMLGEYLSHDGGQVWRETTDALAFEGTHDAQRAGRALALRLINAAGGRLPIDETTRS